LIGKLIWSKDIGLIRIILGPGMSYVNENELDEVRTIEEGFKKAYDQDTKGTVEAIDKLRNFAFQLIHLNVSAENELDIKALVISIGDIGRAAAEMRMEIACVTSSRALGDIAIEAAGQKREPIAIKALSVVGNLALEFAVKGMDTAAKGAAESLGNCGKVSSKIKMETMTSLSEIYLMQVALKAMEINLSETVIASISLLGEIGAYSAEQIMEISTLEAAVILEDLGNAAVRKKSESYAKAAIQALENLGTAVSQYGLKSVLVQVAWSLETIRVFTLEQNLKDACRAAKDALESLNTAEMLDEEQNLEKIQEIKKFHSLFLKKS
jgi:ribosomal protein S11